jgi:hypothetical protein
MKIDRWIGGLFLLSVAGLFGLFAVARAESPDVRGRFVAPANLAAGAAATVIVEMALGSNWHVNSHTPSEKFLIPTEVKLTASAGSLSAVRYPRQVEKRFPFSEKPMAVYEGTVRFEADLSLPRDASGTVSLAGTLAYQACNDKQCFPPAKVPLEASIAVSKAER